MAVSTGRALRNREVSITGRLASMTRDQAVARLDAAGARYVSRPRSATDILVVGNDGWPLDDDGRPTRSLREAGRLRDAGAPIEIVAEESFLGLLGKAPAESGQQYTIGQLARILEVPQAEIRSWIRRGLVAPARVERRLAFFDFREVANARALCRLLRLGVRPSRLRRSLGQLASWLPVPRPAVGELELSESAGGELLVRLPGGTLAEPSGQLRFDFAPSDEGEPTTLPSIHRRDARDWFADGVRLEEGGDLEGAADAYHEALLAGEQRPEICFNLGNVLHSMRRKGEAAQRFMQAVELDPEYVEAWNNLGNTLSELGRSERAVRAYEQALELEPGYADAHFNLAATLEAADRHAEAREHWEAYLRLDPNSHDAEFVRERLRGR